MLDPFFGDSSRDFVVSSTGEPECAEKEEAPRILINEEDGGPLEFVVDGGGDSGDGEADPSPLLLHLSEDRVHRRFCVDRASRRGRAAVAALVCDDALPCRDRPCVRACCPFGHDYRSGQEGGGGRGGGGGGACEVAATAPAVSAPWPYGSRIFRGLPPACQEDGGKILRLGSLDRGIEVEVESGNLTFRDDDGGTRRTVDQTHYCVHPVNESFFLALVCPGEVSSGDIADADYFLPERLETALLVLCGCSAVSLLLALLVILRRRPGRAARPAAQVASGGGVFAFLTVTMICMLFPFYLLLIVLLLAGDARTASVFCLVGGFALQFFFLSAVAWLNCMCFEVWRSLRRITAVSPSSTSSAAGCCCCSRSYAVYAAWAWGAPAGALAAALLAAHLTSSSFSSSSSDRCHLIDDSSPLHYLHAAAAPCLILNLLFYADTARNLCCGLWRNCSSRDGGEGDLDHSRTAGSGHRAAIAFR